MPGGANNVAGGKYSFAAGQQAQASNQGAFVWADSQNATFTSTGNNQFLIRAEGGVGIGTASPGELLEVDGTDTTIRVRNLNDPVGGFVGDTFSSLQFGMYNPTNTTQGVIPAGVKRSFFGFNSSGKVGSITNNFAGSPAFRNVLDDGSGNMTIAGTVTANGVLLTSDRNAKENFTSPNGRDVLAKVAAMPISEWNYKNGPAEARHMGPMAQDFHAAFGLDGADDKHISVVDEGGVALAAIQGLNQKLNEKDAEIQKLKEKAGQVDSLEKRLSDLEKMVQTMSANK